MHTEKTTGQNQPSDVGGKKYSRNWYHLNSGRHSALLRAAQRLQGNHWKDNLQAKNQYFFLRIVLFQFYVLNPQ